MRGAIVPVFPLLFLATEGVVRLVEGRRHWFRALHMLDGLWELGSFTSAPAAAPSRP